MSAHGTYIDEATIEQLRVDLSLAHSALLEVEKEKELYRTRWLGCVTVEEAQRLREALVVAQRKIGRMESDKLDEAWDRINTLGGRKSEGDDYKDGYTNGIADTVDDALAIIEDLGGMNPARRKADNSQFGVGA